MDGVSAKNKLEGFVKKYKYVILVGLVGVFLMLLPSDSKNEQTAMPETTGCEGQINVAEQLENILSTVRGAGAVRVFLSVEEGEEKVYQADTEQTQDDASMNARRQTVIITDSQRNQAPVLNKTISPKYLGAVVVCQGGDDPTIRLLIVEAVSKATGLGANRIAVLKMN